MVKKPMYQKIQKLKREGLDKKHIAKRLGVDRATVTKYLKMSGDQYRDYINKLRIRPSVFDRFREEILAIYGKNGFRRLQMSAVYDCLEEKHSALPAGERSLRNYINKVIETGGLVIKEHVRMYQKVSELPLGQQAQLDFGQYKLDSGVKAWIFACVLSASRVKYVKAQSKPFTALDVIEHLLDCFEYFGGMPHELVIDQDAALVVSENKGDIIYTEKFKYFREEMQLKMYVCRKADPESKGKVENVIKFVKNNFLDIRRFNTVAEINESLPSWLNRRANGKISQATKQIPSEVLREERKHLRGLRPSIFRKDSVIDREERCVNDKSMIAFSGSSYSVPTQYRNRVVEIYSTMDKLFIFDAHTGQQLVEHTIAALPGSNIVERSHFRKTEKTVADLKTSVSALFNLEQWNIFCNENFRTFSRYVRDQCISALKYYNGDFDLSILQEAIQFCLENKTFSFKNLLDTYNSFQQDDSSFPEEKPSPVEIEIPSLAIQTRPLREYAEMISGEMA